jgi:hypothetical protein
MNIVMFCFKIKGLLWYIKDFLLKEKSICMVEYNKLISEFDFHFYSLLIPYYINKHQTVINLNNLNLNAYIPMPTPILKFHKTSPIDKKSSSHKLAYKEQPSFINSCSKIHKNIIVTEIESNINI